MVAFCMAYESVASNKARNIFHSLENGFSPTAGRLSP